MSEVFKIHVQKFFCDKGRNLGNPEDILSCWEDHRPIGVRFDQNHILTFNPFFAFLGHVSIQEKDKSGRQK